jgi:dTDP-4-amino-4,6-dideoxygalactose transaminase
MICFAEEENDRLARQLAWLGINKDTYARSNAGTYKWKYDVDYVGYKYNGNAIMAAIALVQLKYLDEENARRREIVAMYNRGFAGNPNIRIIPAPLERAEPGKVMESGRRKNTACGRAF